MYNDVIIIGAGPVGLFTVFQAGMLNMRCHVIDALPAIGGQCTALYPEKPIYDIPAYPQITAGDLIKQLERQVAPFKPVYHLQQKAVSLTKSDTDHFVVMTSSGTELSSKIVIIAAGAGAFAPTRLPINGIEDFENKSVFYHIRDPEYFRRKKVMIVGGGDSAVDWAVVLSDIADRVYVVHRRNKFRASPESVKQMHQLVALGKIVLILGYQLDNITGMVGHIESVELKDLNGNYQTVQVDALCAFFGLAQSLETINEWGLNTKNHYINVELPYCTTNVDGIYAIGDVAHYPGKLKFILTGFAEAASAVHHAYNKVFDGRVLHFEYSTTKGVPIR